MTIRSQLRSLALALLLSATVASAANAQFRLFATNPFTNFNNMANLIDFGLWELNPATGVQITGKIITSNAGVVSGAQSITVDPTTGTVYVILKINNVSGRVLATINVDTAVATAVGNLGDNFSSISFRRDGQLFGVTGDGASVPETLYLIDKSDASTTVARPLGAGADGEVIAYNPVDHHFYHWSGGAIVMEKISAEEPYDITPITTNTSVGEIFGAVWSYCANAFLVTDIGSEMQTVDVDGNFGPILGDGVNDQRGLAMIPPNACAPTYAPNLSPTSLGVLASCLALFGVGFLRRRTRTAPLA